MPLVLPVGDEETGRGMSQQVRDDPLYYIKMVEKMRGIIRQVL